MEPSRKRGRPPKDRAPLDRHRIVVAALSLADEGGLEALTVRGVAEALSVTPMAVYNHVSDKQGLIAAIFDHMVAAYEPTEHDEADVHAWLETTFVRIHRAFYEHRALIPLISTWFAMGPAAVSMTLFDRCLERLVDDGWSGSAAVGAFYTLLAFTVGHAAIESSTHAQFGGPPSPEALRRYELTMESLALGKHPTVARLAPELAVAFGPARFESALRHIVRGLRKSD
jgi:AcrR family transcriptional regulator